MNLPRCSHSRSLMLGTGSGAAGSAWGSVMSAVTPAMTIVPTSTLPPSSGNKERPTSSSFSDAVIVTSYSVCAGRSSSTPSSRNPKRGKKLISVSPLITSSPPVLARTCSAAISVSACSSIKTGSSTMTNTTSASSAPRIQRMISIVFSLFGF